MKWKQETAKWENISMWELEMVFLVETESSWNARLVVWWTSKWFYGGLRNILWFHMANVSAPFKNVIIKICGFMLFQLLTRAAKFRFHSLL